MNMTLTLEPVDVFMPRGNRMFGGGVHGESVMPPWPSVFSGALASRALADAGRIGEVTRAPHKVECTLAETLGADFALTATALTRGDEAFFPLPADLVVVDGPELVRLSPTTVAEFAGVATSSGLHRLPALASPSRSKPLAGQ